VYGVDHRAASLSLEDRYLGLLKLCLTGLAVPEPRSIPVTDGGGEPEPLAHGGVESRVEGRDWPAEGFTMVGLKRLDNLQHCVEEVLAGDVPGDFVETGVWRGGASIFVRALLALRSVGDRIVVAADSFEGLPAPDEQRFPADAASRLHEMESLSVPLETVKENFRRFGLLDDQVQFVQGWFRDTLPRLAGRRWAVIRLDGDMYESTMVALENLYPGLSPGGFLIVDDYVLRPCRAAVHDYREEHSITEPIEQVDGTGAFWRKEAAG
jgi:hypothetical protein